MQFIDLDAQQSRIRERIFSRLTTVLDHGKYIMGPEVLELESALASFCGAKYCVSCGNGTDALQLALMAFGIGPGDSVFVPSFTFAASAEAVCLVGATPIFVDIDANSFNLDPNSLALAIEHANATALNPKAVIAVDLFGLPADYFKLEAIVKAEGLRLICDSAQGWGASINGRSTGSFGDITTTSFFPAKPLGCYGDGGALFTDSTEIATRLDSLRVHGKGAEKYDNVRVGTNSRLDSIQAAILLEKLAIYSDELKSRNDVATRYTAALQNHFKTPETPIGYRSTWAQYTLQANDQSEREGTMNTLKKAGIPSVIYYPRPLHTQTAYSCFPKVQSGLPNSERAASRVFSLPMHPYLSEFDQDRVIDTLIRKQQKQ